MRVLVTGATGFIGIRLSLELAKLGHSVHALYRTKKKTKHIKHDNIKLFKGDITDIESLEKAIQGCNSLFHLAAYAKVWSKNKNIPYNINYLGTENILKVAHKYNIKKIVITSSAGVLGPSIKNIVNEESKRDTPFFNEYERTKWMSEELVKKYNSECMDIVIVNPSRVFGPGLLSDSNGVTKMIKLYYKGIFRFLPGDGKSIGNYSFIDDVVSGHILALERGKNGERYILGGENISFINLFKKISQFTGKKRIMVKLPLPIMLTISGVMWIIAEIFKIQPLITPPWVKKYNRNWELSSEKAIKELGYQITPINIALEKTIEYLKQNKHI